MAMSLESSAWEWKGELQGAGPARTSLGGWTVTSWWSEQDYSSTVTPCGLPRKLQCRTAGPPFCWLVIWSSFGIKKDCVSLENLNESWAGTESRRDEMDFLLEGPMVPCQLVKKKIDV